MLLKSAGAQAHELHIIGTIDLPVSCPAFIFGSKPKTHFVLSSAPDSASPVARSPALSHKRLLLRERPNCPYFALRSVLAANFLCCGRTKLQDTGFRYLSRAAVIYPTIETVRGSRVARSILVALGAMDPSSNLGCPIPSSHLILSTLIPSR